MRIVLVLVMVLVSGQAVHAQMQTFYFHHSDTPVPVPGGTTDFFLDALAPGPPIPLVDKRIIASGATATLPTFVAPAFAADTMLSPIASVRLHIAANQKMHGCADYTTELFKLDGAGVPTSIGSASVVGGEILQGSAGGTVGATSHLLEFSISDPSVLTGQSLALTTSFTNQCGINRSVFFAYDGSTAPSRVRFQCCLSIAAKCSYAKMKAVATLASCLAGAEAKAAGKGVVLDPAGIGKCEAKAGSAFAKAEDRGGCLTIGDGPARSTESVLFASGLAAALDPGAPHQNRCGASKLKLAGSSAKCLLALEAKAAGKAQFLEPDLVAAATCRDKLALGFGKLESKPGCDTTGDAAATQAAIDAFVSSIATAFACPCF